MIVKFIRYQIRFALPIWFILLVTSILPDNRLSIRIRGFLVAIFLPGFPDRLRLGRDVTLLGADRLYIGNNVYIAKGCWLNSLGNMTICSDVQFGPYVVAVTTKHTLDNGSVSQGGTVFEPVEIGQGSWVASHVTITSGSVIPEASVIAANSVVLGVLKRPGLYGGVPAKYLKGL
jgi:acetyltransferase-like isoleucine patch superfamily enzyme